MDIFIKRICKIILLIGIIYPRILGLETDTRAYFTGITILISLPTGTKIFNWLSTYLGNLLL